MKIYLISLGAGLLVGVIYGLLNVRSPAPPLIALIGLFGILIGEQLVPVARHVLAGSGPHVAWHRAGPSARLFGAPSGPATTGKTSSNPESSS